MDADNRLGAGDLVSYKGDLYYAKPNGSRACYLYLTPEDCKNDTNRQYSPSPRSVKIIKRQDHLARRSRKQGDNKSVRKITWPEEAASKATTDLSSSSSSSSAPSSASTVPSSPVPLRVNVPTLPPLDELALQLLDGPTFDHQQLILFGHLDGPGFNRWNDVDLVTIYFAGRNDSRGFPGVNDEPRSTGAEDYKLCLREGPFSVVNPRALLTEVLHGPCPEIYDVEYAYEQKLAHARLTLALLWKAIASLKVVRCCTLEGARLLVEACFGPEAAAAGKEASSRLEAGTQVVLNFGGREVPMVVQHHPAYHLKHGRGHHPTEKQNTRCVRELLARGTRQPLTRGSWEQYLRRARAAETWTSRYSQRPTKPRPPTGKDKGPEPVSDETEGDAETRDAHNFADEVLWWQQEMNSVEEQLEKLTMAKKHETSSLVEQVRQITREKEKLLRTVSGLEAEVKELTKLKEEREWVIDHQKAELGKWENNLGQLCRNVGFRPDDRRAPTRREKTRKGKKKMKNEKGGESEAEEEEA